MELLKLHIPVKFVVIDGLSAQLGTWPVAGWYGGAGEFFESGRNDVVYNIGDAINKIGFGLVVYNLAVQSKNPLSLEK